MNQHTDRYWEGRWRDEKAHNDALMKSLEMIEYVSRKDSLTDNERLQSVRTVVCAALSRVGAVVGSAQGSGK